MVDKVREGLHLLGKLVSWENIVNGFTSPEDIEEDEHSISTKRETEPMWSYWASEKKLYNQNQDAIDPYLYDGHSISQIPDVTEEQVKESQYNFGDILTTLNNVPALDVPEPPKVGTGISSSGRDAGVVAGIVVAVISGVIILAALIAVVLYRHYVHRNVTSMNFDNPVYRKTTEDQFALEKNGYTPGNKLYLSTVGEEAQEPLNTPGTNEFV